MASHATYNVARANYVAEHAGNSLPTQSNNTLFPYLCPTCHQAFKTDAGRKQHMYIHSEKVTPFKCDWCERAYTHSASLSRHKRMKHAFLAKVKTQNNTKCQNCDQRFQTLVDLQRHNPHCRGARSNQRPSATSSSLTPFVAAAAAAAQNITQPLLPATHSNAIRSMPLQTPIPTFLPGPAQLTPHSPASPSYSDCSSRTESANSPHDMEKETAEEVFFLWVFRRN